MLEKDAIVKRLIEILVEFVPSIKEQALAFSHDYVAQRALLRGLMNMHKVRNELPDEYFAMQDALLQEELKEKKLVSIEDLDCSLINKNIYLFQGDITCLKVDAIVNAANSSLLGCFQAGHNCIDNCIHSAAGLQLRYECDKIVSTMPGGAKTGSATITHGFNLLSKYVIHVVGPSVVFGVTVKDKDKQQLASCYSQALQLARENNINTIAFCCVSTGAFGFPYLQAAQIAVKTVNDDLKEHNNDLIVIFDVFEERDLNVYKDLLFPKEEKKDTELHPFFNINLI